MTPQKELSEKDVRHIAKLAGLTLSVKEVQKFRLQLTEVLKYIQIISSIKLTGVNPVNQVTNLENVVKNDEVVPSLTQEEALGNATNIQNGFIKVKAVFNE